MRRTFRGRVAALSMAAGLLAVWASGAAASQPALDGMDSLTPGLGTLAGGWTPWAWLLAMF